MVKQKELLMYEFKSMVSYLTKVDTKQSEFKNESELANQKFYGLIMQQEVHVLNEEIDKLKEQNRLLTKSLILSSIE
ncbi:hypothetical protein TP70_08105 [Staphylococcus microti]|uniref:Uncharacterized protein n=1 Tax=Staphylococcus microti TaxID=569857 RepID=A0A0D6XNG6_9STAP|nr:hypothetical protein [Staphylococcus microti]KIX90359.1 hypothetical protein TP70_08105 [Staphylococcus microti]PNZ77104.1 hypothetical protein CD132_11020 [Staphylococcus microti]SUM57363.1 Uncharacterised protein [Staphylococcus microti]